MALLATVAAMLAAPTPAMPDVDAVAAGDRADCPRSLERTYTRNYRRVARLHGRRAAGRDLRRRGVRFRGHTFDATCGELDRSRRQLGRLLAAPALMYSTDRPPAQPPAGVRSDFDVAALPSCTWVGESGGDYGAYNPSSGAFGKYQVIPSTWAALCADLARDPAGQERCAARVYAAQGAGAWVLC